MTYSLHIGGRHTINKELEKQFTKKKKQPIKILVPSVLPPAKIATYCKTGHTEIQWKLLQLQEKHHKSLTNYVSQVH